jgi:proteic killer suppression protein
VIQSFKDPKAKALFEGEAVGRVGWQQIQRVAARKLAMLDAAAVLGDLKAPPNNKLEALRGDRAGQHSIRVNDQWRVCFVWTDAGPQDVEIVDYH